MIQHLTSIARLSPRQGTACPGDEVTTYGSAAVTRSLTRVFFCKALTMPRGI
jgi:hypothetical protein